MGIDLLAGAFLTIARVASGATKSTAVISGGGDEWRRRRSCNSANEEQKGSMVADSGLE